LARKACKQRSCTVTEVAQCAEPLTFYAASVEAIGVDNSEAKTIFDNYLVLSIVEVWGEKSKIFLLLVPNPYLEAVIHFWTLLRPIMIGLCR